MKKMILLISLFFLFTSIKAKSVNNSRYNTQCLRSNASFRVEVYNKVNWIPANILGKSNLTNKDIKNLIGKDPEYIQNKIDTLYEVIQYIELSDFKNASDNIRIRSNNINWEHHKPGYLSITTNEGNCATISNLLNYLLKDDYEEVGFIQISRVDGGGHVINYIKNKNRYYTIDLTNYRNDFKNAVIETGKISDYKRGRNRILANIHETKNLLDFIVYCRDFFNSPPAISCYYIAPDVLPIDCIRNSKFFVTFPDTCKSIINMIFDDPDDNVSLKFSTPPEHNRYPKEWEPYNKKY